MLKVLHRTRGVWLMKCSYVKLQTYIAHVSWDWECGRSEERVWSRVTDLWCIAWVMMFTTPFHHPSPNNTWNSQNYISLAILCKIFTFSLRTLTPPFLAPCAFSCACACAHKKRHLERPVWCWRELRRKLERRRPACVEEWGCLQMFPFFDIMFWCPYPACSRFRSHLQTYSLKYGLSNKQIEHVRCFLTTSTLFSTHSLCFMPSGGLEYSQRLLHFSLVSHARKVWTRKYGA